MQENLKVPTLSSITESFDLSVGFSKVTFTFLVVNAVVTIIYFGI